MTALTRSPEPLSPADERVLAWLDRFERALAGRDGAGAAACFAETCFWRDLVAFTWNITTLEGRDAIRDMLAARIDAVREARARGVLTMPRLLREIYGPDLPAELEEGATWNILAATEHIRRTG